MQQRHQQTSKSNAFKFNAIFLLFLLLLPLILSCWIQSFIDELLCCFNFIILYNSIVLLFFYPYIGYLVPEYLRLVIFLDFEVWSLMRVQPFSIPIKCEKKKIERSSKCILSLSNENETKGKWNPLIHQIRLYNGIL